MDVITDKDLRYVIAALPSFGQRYSHLVMGYAQLFGVTPMHIKAKKLRLIIEEMKKLFDAESFAWEKKTYSISHAGIGEALDIMIKRDFSKHLTNHNYLKTVMIDISNREGKDKSKREEKDLRGRESNALASGGHVRRAGSSNTPNDGAITDRALQQDEGYPETKPQALPKPFPKEAAAAGLRAIGSIMKDIGIKP